MIGSDRTLIEKWRATHDAGAFAEIVSRHSAMVYGTCRRVLGNPTDAEDVAQECFLELAEGRAAIRSSLGGWLHRAAVHRSLNRLKADSRRKQREARFAAQVSYSSGPSWDDIKAHIDEAIAALPDKLREPVIHRFLEGQTHEAIAQNLGISRSTVQYRLARGVEEIRKLLKRRGISVATAVLTAMLGTILGKAAALPASLTAVLGKVAIAGTGAPGAAAAGGVALGSKLALVGGTAIMWKNVSIALGVVVVALGLSYGVHFRAERRASRGPVPTQTEQPMVSRTAEERAREAARQQASSEGAQPGVPHDGAGERLAEEGKEGEFNALLALERLLQTAYEKAGAEREQAGGGTLEPFSSENIPVDNGAHYFLLAAELFPDMSRDWLFAKWDEMRAKGWSDDPELRALFAACQSSIDAVRTGVAAGNAVMPEPRGPLEQMPYLRTFRDLARVMAMEAQMLAAEGKYAPAFEAYTTLLNFANESSYGSSLVHVAIGLAMDDMALPSLRDVITWGTASPQDYQYLIDSMRTLDAQAHPVWESVSEEVRLMTSWLEAEMEAGTDFRAFFLEETSNNELRSVLAAMSDAEFESYLRETLRGYQQFVEYFARPYYEVQAMDMSALIGNNPLSRAEFPSLMALRARVTRTSAEACGTTLMAGIESYKAQNGSYPGSLQNLVPTHLDKVPEDPFSGSTFTYRPTETGYLLYSTGADMQDNGGAVNAWDAEGADLVFHGG